MCIYIYIYIHTCLYYWLSDEPEGSSIRALPMTIGFVVVLAVAAYAQAVR